MGFGGQYSSGGGGSVSVTYGDKDGNLDLTYQPVSLEELRKAFSREGIKRIRENISSAITDVSEIVSSPTISLLGDDFSSEGSGISAGDLPWEEDDRKEKERLYDGDTKAFYKALAHRESTNNPREHNGLGFIGLYQMGEAALVDAGYYKAKPPIPGKKPGAQYNNDWKGSWTGKNGINSLEDFKKNPEIQTKAVREYHKIVWRYLKPYHYLEGQEMAGVRLTKSGMIAASHLVGMGDFRNKFLASGGQDIPEDKNDVPCTEYLRLFKGYQLEF